MQLKSFVFAGIILLCSLQSFAQYKTGYYYQKDGTKVEGLLRLEYGDHGFKSKENGDCYISFKTTREDKREKFTAADICCFVIEKDSFAVIKNFTLNFMVDYPRDFAQVLQDGKIKLYLYYSVVSHSMTAPSKTVKEWVIEKNGVVEKLTRKKFKELMPVLLEDYPELKAMVTSKAMGFKQTPDIILRYNNYFKSLSQK